MASFSSILLVLMSFYLVFTIVFSLPSTTDEWLLHVNKYVLHKLIVSDCQDGKTANFDSSIADSVLSNILASNDISEADVKLPDLSAQILKYVGTMISKLKVETKRGGYYATKLVDKWKNCVFNLKLGGVKRKLEDELKREKKRRKHCENEISEQTKHIKTMEKERKEMVSKL